MVVYVDFEKGKKMAEEKKPAVKSLGVWGSLATIGAILAFFKGLPPELLDDSREIGLAIVALVGSVGSLIGRWRAYAQISGLFKSK